MQSYTIFLWIAGWTYLNCPGCRWMLTTLAVIEVFVITVWISSWVCMMSERQRSRDPDYYAYQDFVDYS